MKPLIFSVMCIFAVCAVALPDPVERLPIDPNEALGKLTNLSWDRKTPLETTSAPYSIHRLNFNLSPADSGSLEEETILDEPPGALSPELEPDNSDQPHYLRRRRDTEWLTPKVRINTPANSRLRTGEFKLNPGWLDGVGNSINVNWLADRALSPTEVDPTIIASAEQFYTIPTPGALVLTVLAIASIGWLHRRKIL